MIAVARWPMVLFDLPARNEENTLEIHEIFFFQILLGTLSWSAG